MKKIAIFDIDGTLFRSSLLIELVNALVDARIFPVAAQKMYRKAFVRWLDRKGSYEEYVGAVVAAYHKYLKGVRRADFLKVARHVIAVQKNRTYRYTLDLVRDLKKKRYHLIAISNSPKEIVDAFCKHLGFRSVYGRVYETDGKGRFTGRLLFEDLISDKAKIVRRAIKNEGFTLRGSVGVGDTEADISFLRLVGYPVCFNPNRGLWRRARRRGWRIVVERKDMVYYA